MSSIDFSNMSPFEYSVVMSHVHDCIKTASRFGGKVYGGFVRDVVVPRLTRPSGTYTFKDVDLWFKSRTDANNFVSAMGDSFVRFQCVSTTNGSYPGAFARNQYHLTAYDTCLAWIDVVVSPTLPVNDFDVNEVTYHIDEEGNWVTSAPSRLIGQINIKRAIMLLSYQELIANAKDLKTANSKSNPLCKLYYQERIKRIFTSKGWEIFLPTV